MALPPESTARINATIAKAEEQLGIEVTAFFSRCRAPGFVERELRRKPFSYDLGPFFAEYAAAVFTAEANERLAVAKSPQRFCKSLEQLLQNVVSRISRPVSGVWERVVLESCMRVGLGIWSSEYGEYGQADFMHPSRTGIEGALRTCVKHWEGEAWSKFAQPQERAYKTDLARNIAHFRNECGWSFDELSKKTGLDKTLILGHVNKGKGANPSTIKMYADAFSKKLGRSIAVADLQGSA